MPELNNPTVSVIIPTYNRKADLARAIRTVVAQSYKDWELTVVDDASPDGTEEVVRSFGDRRVGYFRHRLHRGAGAVRNCGICRARGKYVAFLDSDDEWFPEKLAQDVAAFARPGGDVGLVYCGKELVDLEGRLLLRRIPSLEGDLYRQLLAHDFIGSCSRVAVRRDILEAAGGFDESLPSGQDWDMWVRAARMGRVACVPECLVRRHLGHAQISGSLKRILDGHLMVVEKHRNEFDGTALSRHWADLAAMLMNYDLRKGREMALESLRMRPFQLRAYASLTASFLGMAGYRWAFQEYARRRHGYYAGRAAV
jgi:glycosyltransferase involved in cell wall biosynthesis